MVKEFGKKGRELICPRISEKSVWASKSVYFSKSDVIVIVGTSLASRKTQDFTLQDLSRKTLVARLARQKFT